MTSARRYPVARDRAFKADIESTARTMAVMGGCYYSVYYKDRATTCRRGTRTGPYQSEPPAQEPAARRPHSVSFSNDSLSSPAGARRLKYQPAAVSVKDGRACPGKR